MPVAVIIQMVNTVTCTFPEQNSNSPGILESPETVIYIERL